MKFVFRGIQPSQVKDKILQALAGRELGNMVDIVVAGNQLEVVISKLGTSRLVFENCAGSNDELVYELKSEKIAFAHRVFKEEVKDKISKLITQLGGVVG